MDCDDEKLPAFACCNFAMTTLKQHEEHLLAGADVKF